MAKQKAATKKPAAKKPTAKKPAAKKPAKATTKPAAKASKPAAAKASKPVEAAAKAAPASGWADEGLKSRATLAYLGRSNPKELQRAIAEHVDGEDMYLSDAMQAYLVDYPLDAKALGSLKDLDNAYEHVMELIPYFDGESDPFVVASWAEIANLPALERIALNSGEDALPAAADLANHPSLREVSVTLEDEKKPRHKAVASLASASGFGPTSRIGYHATLTRGASAKNADLLLRLHEILPRRGYKKGKAYQLDLVNAQVVDGALRASFRLFVHDASGTIAGEHNGELTVLPANGTEAMLAANAKKLDQHIVEKRTLPTSL